jgi:hypothetical protein
MRFSLTHLNPVAKPFRGLGTWLGHALNLPTYIFLLQNHVQEVRVKFSARDKEKIPPSKLFEFELCFFLVKFDVEKNLIGDGGNDDNNDDARVGEDVDDHEELGDDFQDSFNRICGNGATGMDTDTGNSAPVVSRGGVQDALSCHPTTLEESVRARILEEVPLVKDSDVITVDKPVEVDVGRHLL